MTERYYTTSAAFLEALAEAGISYIFANLGSDHPGIIEALAQAKADGRADELPQLIICPHETVAFSAEMADGSTLSMVSVEPARLRELTASSSSVPFFTSVLP